MIIKSYEINKINTLKNRFILLHGKNEGLQDEITSSLLSKNKNSKILKYDEKEIIDNLNDFYDNVLNKSLFETSKVFIINRASDKLMTILDQFINKNLTDVIFIITANILDKRSKLRSYFEKKNNCISIALYSDTNQTLIKFTQNFFNKMNIPISFENINIIVNRCAGDRGYLKNELKKISLFAKNKKKINTIDLIRLTNLTEDFSINELIDMCLSKNKKKTINILNDNNFETDDSILIIRTFLNKSKRLLNLLYEYKINNDLNTTILNAKPPIFWKDKQIMKQQIKYWTPESLKIVIYNLNEIELKTKKFTVNPFYILSDFILDKSSMKTNS